MSATTTTGIGDRITEALSTGDEVTFVMGHQTSAIVAYELLGTGADFIEVNGYQHAGTRKDATFYIPLAAILYARVAQEEFK